MCRAEDLKDKIIRKGFGVKDEAKVVAKIEEGIDEEANEGRSKKKSISSFIQRK